tara:strand:+ start:293 stop:538 length:246 start_codon:yes stop_codon:yes gene_type:complete
MAITRAQQAKQMLQDGGMLVNQDLVVRDKDIVVMLRLQQVHQDMQILDHKEIQAKVKLVQAVEYLKQRVDLHQLKALLKRP